MTQSIGVAISGGVDSTAAALLLKKNHSITGFFMDIGQPDFIIQKKRVEEIAERIGFDIHIIDLKEQFKKLVLNYFTDCYFKGKTPNPCMICNREIKFGLFFDSIIKTGIRKVATGHYARLEKTNHETALLTGKDSKKDQSYFLSRLNTKQMAHIIFPLGSMQKKQIYSYVEGKGFTSFKGKESQDICFLKESSVATYLEDLLGASAQKGPILTTKGKEIGRHGGLFRYTVGQRRGLGLPDTTPWYVCHLCPEDNSLVVGKHYELFARRVFAISTHWLTDRKPKKGERYLVRLRYSHPGAEALIESIDDNTLQLVFNEPQRAIAPGQFAVLYNDSRVIGSAEISQQQD